MPARRAKLLAVFAIVLLVAAALWSRGWALEERPVAHDESLFGYYAFGLAQNGSYEYDPMLHGPLLLETQALIFKVCGSNKWTMRLFPALCGLGLIAAMLLFRPWLGRAGVIAAMLLILCSPTILFYSRFLRNDIPFLLAAVLAVGCLGRACGRRERIFLPPAIISLALMACIKENTVFVLFTLGCYSAALLAVDFWNARKKATQHPGEIPPLINQQERGRWLLRRALPTLCWTIAFWSGVFLFDQVFIAEIAPEWQLADLQLGEQPLGDGAAFGALVFCFLGSVFFFYFLVGLLEKSKRTGNIWVETKQFLWANRYLVGAGCLAAWLLLTLVFTIGLSRPASLIVLARETVAYWWREHATQRLGGPFHYYWRLLIIYELPALVLVAAGMLLTIARRRLLRLLALPVFLILFLSIFTLGCAIDLQAPEQSWLALRYASLLELSHVNTLGNLLWAGTALYWGVCLTFSQLAERRRFQAFAITWLSVSLLCYSYAGEKVPWLVVHITMPVLLLAAEQLALLWRWLSVRQRPIIGQTVLLTGCLALIAWSGFLSWRTCLAEKDWPSEIIVHNHTTPEFEGLAQRILLAAGSANLYFPTSPFHASITGEAVWPMIWYLRNLEQVQWDETQAPELDWFVVDNQDDRTSGGLAVRGSKFFRHEELTLRAHWEFEYATWDEPATGAEDRRRRLWSAVHYYFFREIPGDMPYDEQKAKFLIMSHINQTIVNR